jgi:ABC-type uncharacterized transport system permease subunit
LTINNLTIIGSTAALLYLITWGVIVYRIKKANTTTLLSVGTGIWTLAIILHGLYLFLPLFSHQGLKLDLISAGSLVAWLTSLVLFITTCTRKIEVLSLFVLPLAWLILVLGLIEFQTGKSVQINGALGSHILLSLLGYSTLFLATLQALLLSLQSRHLHNHKPGGLIRSLPALQDMENLLFRLILTGVILLSAGLITGFVFLNDLFGRQVLHKTVLSIIAWVVYTTLLIGHWRQGWRGKKAVTWTIIAFVLLIIAFFGSKFVQEYLIK